MRYVKQDYAQVKGGGGQAGAKRITYFELLTDSLAPMIFSTFKTIFGILSQFLFK